MSSRAGLAPAATGTRGRQTGQAAVELVGGLPIVLITGLVIFQLFAAGYTQTLADGAAEAGAIALAAGDDPERAVRGALPGWAVKRITVRVSGGRVDVELLPPAPTRGLAERLAISSGAWVRPAVASGSTATPTTGARHVGVGAGAGR